MGMNIVNIAIALYPDKEETQKNFDEAVLSAKNIAKWHNEWVVNVIAPNLQDFQKDTILLQAFYEYDEEKKVDNFCVEPTNEFKDYGLELHTEDEKVYVFVVSWNQVWDGSMIADECKVFFSKEKAIDFFKDLKEDEFNSITSSKRGDDWLEGDGNFIDEESGTAMWEYYKEYEADTDHSYLYCEKKEVE